MACKDAADSFHGVGSNSREDSGCRTGHKLGLQLADHCKEMATRESLYRDWRPSRLGFGVLRALRFARQIV
jgi:hypothetical protein